MTKNYTKRSSIKTNGPKIFEMLIKYTSIFHSKVFQNLLQLGFWARKYTI
jgi:hypothetical protein